MSSSAFTALALRVSGFVLILVTILNLGAGFFPPNFKDEQWQLAMTSQIIDQSLMPLVGVVLVAASFWVDHVAQRSGRNSLVTRTLAFGFASFMGLLLVVMVPLQINTVRVLNNKALTNVNQNLSEDQPEFKKTVDEAVERQRQMIQVLMQNPQRLQEAIKNGQINEEQAKLIEQFRADGKNLDQFLVAERKSIETQLKQRVEGQKQTAKDQLRESWKTLFRACATSLAIAAAYLVIGWNGFRRLED